MIHPSIEAMPHITLLLHLASDFKMNDTKSDKGFVFVKIRGHAVSKLLNNTVVNVIVISTHTICNEHTCQIQHDFIKKK